MAIGEQRNARIKNIMPDNPFFLAPMEAVNCASFRVLCKRRGASIVYTDMIDADIFIERVAQDGEEEAIRQLINPQNDERPLAVQLGGGKLETLQTAVRIIEPHADLIDFNVGCPLSYMLGKKGGVYFQKHPDQLQKIIKGLREAITIPFTVKIRAGWDDESINAVEIATMLEEEGVDAVAVHPRTRKQRYRERADWPLVRAVKEAINIPVILSGDVTNAYMAHMAFAHTKCDFIMCARGAKANPSLFKELSDYWKTRQQPERPETTYVKTANQARSDMQEFIELYKERENRYRLSEIKDHALWTATQCNKNSRISQEILSAHDEQALFRIFDALTF